MAGALAGFSANSILTRAAVGGHFADAVTFSEIRLATGALVLFLAERWRRGLGADAMPQPGDLTGQAGPLQPPTAKLGVVIDTMQP